MPRPPKVDPLRASIQNLGRQIADELASAISHGMNAAMHSKGGRASVAAVAAPAARRGRPASAGGNPCKVPGCGRKRAAKGLCQNHYAKAKRLKMHIDSLSNGDLDTLAQDGRALRFKKGR